MSECDSRLWSRGSPGLPCPGQCHSARACPACTAQGLVGAALGCVGLSLLALGARRRWVGAQSWEEEEAGGRAVSSPCPEHPLLPQLAEQQAILPRMLCLPLGDSLPPPELHLQALIDACRAAQLPQSTAWECGTLQGTPRLGCSLVTRPSWCHSRGDRASVT